MASRPDHIDVALLSEYMTGRIDDELISHDIETHIASCCECQDLASGLSGGPTESKIRQLCQANRLPSEPISNEYQIIEELGRGGAGVVYRANQPRLGRSVALKMLVAGSFSSGASLARFRREATALSGLNHRNIVTVFDSGEQQGTPYIAMEWVNGKNLDQWLAAGLPSPQFAAEILIQLADGVHHAHEHGVIHRDLKPQNILVEKSIGTKGELNVKIGDFGLSHLADENFHTQTGQTLGTPAYMAPEVALGRTDLVGRHTDIYGLGTILYQCLTGRPPHIGTKKMTVLQAIAEQDAVSIALLRPETPIDLRTICERCLNRNPTRRFASAMDLKADLQRFLAGEPIESRRISVIERAVKWTRRNPWQVAVGSTVVLALAGGMIGLTLHQHGLAEERDLAAQNYQLARETIEKMLGAIDAKSVLEIGQLRNLTWQQTDEALQLYEYLDRVENTARSKQDLALIKMRAGTFLVAGGDFAGGTRLLDDAAVLLRDLAGKSTNSNAARDLISAQIKLAATLSAQERYREAIAILGPLRAVAEQTDSDHRDFNQISQLTFLYRNLGNALVGLNDHQAAAEIYRLEIEWLQQAIALAPENIESSKALHEAQVCHALSLMAQQKNAEALESYASAIEALLAIQQTLPNDVPIRVAIAVACLNVSNLYAGLGDLEECLAACTRGIEQLKPIIEKDPEHFSAKTNLAMLYGNRAMYGAGQIDASIADWEAAIGFATDDETREYCRSMWLRQLISAKRIDDARREITNLTAEDLSEANQFRIAAVLALLAIHLDEMSEKESNGEDGGEAGISDTSQGFLVAAEKIMSRLKSNDWLNEHPEVQQYLESNEDFELYRKWQESNGRPDELE